MGDYDDKILKLASEFIGEDLEKDDDFFLKSFDPEQAAEIRQALELLGKYADAYPDDVKAALRELAKLAVSAPEDSDKDEDQDEDVKKKGRKWSFSFGALDDDDDPLEIAKDSEAAELIEEIAESFDELDELLKTAAILGKELVLEQQKNKEIDKKINDINSQIQKIARAKGITKSGDNDNERLWPSFSLVRSRDEDEDE